MKHSSKVFFGMTKRCFPFCLIQSGSMNGSGHLKSTSFFLLQPGHAEKVVLDWNSRWTLLAWGMVRSQKQRCLLRESTPGTQLWSAVRTVASKRQYWFQQDEASCHVTQQCLEFIQSKFEDWIILQRTEHHWQIYSLDLSPLEFRFGVRHMLMHTNLNL